MLPAKHWDILVVGAGPAGSSAAAVAARQGARTLLIDAKPRIGEQPHCGEFVPSRMFQEYESDTTCITQSVDAMETRVLKSCPEVDSVSLFRDGPPEDRQGSPTAPRGDGLASASVVKVSEIPSSGFVIDRVRFDRDLARRAAEVGAMVLCSTRLVHVDNGEWIAAYGSETVSLSPKFVVAADGALSTVARLMGMKRPEVLAGVQAEVPLPRSYDRTFVFLERGIVGGYGWLFPKGNVANAGIGVVRAEGIHPNKILDGFLDFLIGLGMIQPGRLAQSGGLIPVSGPRESLVMQNVIFCGDAAGLTHPITGAGIPQAVFSGTMAGGAVASALKTGGSGPLEDYEAEMRGRYGGVLCHALSKRTVMMRHWQDSDFTATCERNWISFKGYRKRVRGGETVGERSEN